MEKNNLESFDRLGKDLVVLYEKYLDTDEFDVPNFIQCVVANLAVIAISTAPSKEYAEIPFVAGFKFAVDVYESRKAEE